MRIDHLVVTCAALEEGVAWAEARLGLPLGPGGRHARFGTWNRLLSLGPDTYLEVIAPEPGTTPEAPRWFGLEAPGAPRLATFAARVDDLDAALAAAPEGAGEALALARDAFAWRVSVRPDGALVMGGAWPTLIEWTRGHPAPGLPDLGVRLTRLEVGHPDAATLRPRLAGDPRLVVVEAAAPALRATLATPTGPVTL